MRFCLRLTFSFRESASFIEASARAAKDRSDHENPLIICVQHSKAVRGDHDLNRGGDAIVIGLRNGSQAASGGIRRRS